MSVSNGRTLGLRGCDALFIDPDFLRNTTFFKGRDKVFLDRITKYLMLEMFPPGQDILTMGESGDKMYFLNRGEVEILVGPELKQIAKLRSGDIFGEMAMFGAQKRAATVRALELCDCRSISHQVFKSILEEFPKERHYFAKLAEERTNQLQQHQDQPKRRTSWLTAFFQNPEVSTVVKSSIKAEKRRHSTSAGKQCAERDDLSTLRRRRSTNPRLLDRPRLIQSAPHAPPDSERRESNAVEAGVAVYTGATRVEEKAHDTLPQDERASSLPPVSSMRVSTDPSGYSMVPWSAPSSASRSSASTPSGINFNDSMASSAALSPDSARSDRSGHTTSSPSKRRDKYSLASPLQSRQRGRSGEPMMSARGLQDVMPPAPKSADGGANRPESCNAIERSCMPSKQLLLKKLRAENSSLRKAIEAADVNSTNQTEVPSGALQLPMVRRNSNRNAHS